MSEEIREDIKLIEDHTSQEYKYGFVTDIEEDEFPKGLNEDIIRKISAKKNEPEWMTEWRLKAYRHWLTIKEPNWAKIHHEKIDFQRPHRNTQGASMGKRL